MNKADLLNTAFLASAAGWENIDGNFLLMFLMAITAFVVLAKNVVWLFRKNPPDNEKFRQVRDCEHLCDANLAAHEKIDTEMNLRLSAMSDHSAKSREKMYMRLAQIESELSALKKENELQTQRLYSFEQKIDRLLERTK